ncbi:hypothetical protein ACVWY2_001050 [Bradyrhizobium sp. JR6.1]
MGDDDDRVCHDGVVSGIGAVPFQHGEFGQMEVAALAIAEHPRELIDPGLAGREQLLAGELGRGAQIAWRS